MTFEHKVPILNGLVPERTKVPITSKMYSPKIPRVLLIKPLQRRGQIVTVLSPW